MSLAQQSDYHQYAHFNAFFTRSLKENVHSWPVAHDVIACPVDGVVSQLGGVRDHRILQAKGRQYSLTALLAGCEQLSELFRDGLFFTAYLAPRDYHRVHMPLAATLRTMIHVPGNLFSVNPQTVAGVDRLFARNERVICHFETAHGPMAVIMVGAVVVASVAISWHGTVMPAIHKHKQQLQRWDYEDQAIQLAQGDEMGYFAVGSTVIVLLGQHMGQWQSSLNADDVIRCGQAIGQLSPDSSFFGASVGVDDAANKY